MKDNFVYIHYLWLEFAGLLISLAPALIILMRPTLRNRYFAALIVSYCILMLSSIFKLNVFGLDRPTILTAIGGLFLVQPILGLYFLRYFPEGPKLAMGIRKSLPFFLLLLVLMLISFRPTFLFMKAGLAIGLCLVTFFSGFLVLRLVKDTIHSRRESGKAFVVSAVFFSHASYLILGFIFVFSGVTSLQDLYLLFQLVTIFATLLLSVGLLLLGRRSMPATQVKKASGKLWTGKEIWKEAEGKLR